MAEFKGLVDRIVREEDGQGMIEYALIAALVGVLLIAALTALRGGILDSFNDATTGLGGTPAS